MRSIQQNVKVLVEGYTEMYYISGLKNNTTTQLNIEPPVNMDGGGYKNFIKEIKKLDYRGCVAIFIVIDLDKYHEDNDNLKKLISLCKSKTKSTKIPYFLIGTNLNFEYFSCCHCKKYNNSDTKSYIIKNFNYKSVKEYKSDSKIYSKLNKSQLSYNNALQKLNKNYTLGNTFFKNDYSISKQGANIIISINNLIINEDSISQKHSNIIEFFKIIGL